MTISKMTIEVPSEFKNQVKASAAITGKKMREYIMEAVEEKIRNDNLENKYLGELAIKADKEGYLSKKASEKLLQEMLDA